MEIGKGEHMNFKIVGAVLVVCACGCCGFLSAAHHLTNIRLLQNLINVFDFMVCELQYRATPLPKLCRQAGEQCSGKIGQILYALSDELEAQVSPNVEICMASVLCRHSELHRTIYSTLNELGKQLGKFDLSGQIHGIENCRNECAAKLTELSKDKENRLRSYQTLGLCAGAAIAILFV